MAGLCWMAVTLGLLLSVGNSSATFARPDQNQLTKIVDGLWDKYNPSYMKPTGYESFPMFSLAVSIPYDNNKKMYDISLVTDDDQVLKNTILGCEVYSGTRVVAATVLRWPNVLDQCPDRRVQWSDVLSKCKPTTKTWADVKRDCPTAVREGRADHAEYRSLTAFNTLTNNRNQNDFMLFYVLSSPCDKRCAAIGNRWSILNLIKKIKNWTNYAFVFSYVFKPKVGDDIPEKDLKGALERLGESIDLKYIFRCNGLVSCTSCSTGDGQVTPFCYRDPKPGPSNNLPSTSFILPPHGRRDSPSQRGQGERDQTNNDINTSAGDSTNVDGNSGGVVGQGGSGGGRGRRRRGRGKKGKKTNKGEGVSSSQRGLEVRSTDVGSNTGGGLGGSGRGRGKVRKVGGRRVGQKRGGGANKKKSNQTQRKKKTQSRGKTQWRQEAQGRAEKQSEKRQESTRPQRRGKQQRGGEMRRINQPPKRKGKKQRGG